MTRMAQISQISAMGLQISFTFAVYWHQLFSATRPEMR